MAYAIYSQNDFVRGLLAHHCAAAGYPVVASHSDPAQLTGLGPDTILCVHLDGDCDRAIRHYREVVAATVARLVIVREGQICETLLAAARERADALMTGPDAVALMFEALSMIDKGYRILPSGADVVVAPAANVAPPPLAADAQAADGPLAAANLSPKEATILRELSRGATNKMIALRLENSDATVKVHLRAIYRKLGVANRTQAAMWGQRNLPPHVAAE